MADLKLRRLPDRTPIKLTISVSPLLGQALNDYAQLYQNAYGEAEAIQDLVPAMLEAFLESDRVFLKHRRGKAGHGTAD